MRPLIVTWLIAASATAGLAGCAGEHRSARDKYNQGVAALAKGDHEAAEKLLTEASGDAAGVDPELRFRAAYDLGVACAAHADQLRTGKDADLDKAYQLAEQSEAWFLHASRLQPDDADTRSNLAIMKARIKQLGDELLRGAGKLEARLDRLIVEQRSVLDQTRGAWLAIKQAGGRDPLAGQNTLVQLADSERGIVAEAGVVGDLAADEIDAIGKKAEDKRSEEEKIRIVQLKNLDLYLMEARTRITEARRKLQELSAEDGMARSEAALVALKRAREQLLDPITVMQRVAQDERAVLQDTALSDTGVLALHGARAEAGPGTAPGPLPSWLEPAVIAERQGSIHDRLEEVRARLSAAAEAPASTPAAAPGATPAAPGPTGPAPEAGHGPDDAKRAKLIERVKAALPSVGEAGAAMDRARRALVDKQIKDALEQEGAALDALARAIEQFSDLKQLVELAYAEHQELLHLLAPEAAKQLDSTQRARRTRDALSHNLARMPRIGELLADEIAQLDEQARQLAAKASALAPAAGTGSAGSTGSGTGSAGSAGSGAGSTGSGAGSAGSTGSGAGSAADPGQAEAQKLEQAKQQLEQARQQMTHADELRGQAATALAALDKALTGNTDPMPPAKQADDKLTELRKLFFSVIEHLQELIREQSETRDQTAAASGEDDFNRAPRLPGLIGRQEGHAQMARAITEALAQQADAAGKQPAQPGAQGPSPKTLAAAADEVRQSQGDMADARGTLIKARDTKNSTESLTPGVTSQGKAIEHLENALKLLQPPQNQKQNDKDQQQQQQQQKKQEPQPQQGGAGQRARDKDAERQRDRHNRDAQNDPVEKDW
jgi:hypothetical protein